MVTLKTLNMATLNMATLTMVTLNMATLTTIHHGDTHHGDTHHGDTHHGDTQHGNTHHGDTHHGDTRNNTSRSNAAFQNARKLEFPSSFFGLPSSERFSELGSRNSEMFTPCWKPFISSVHCVRFTEKPQRQVISIYLYTTPPQPFYSPFSGTTRMSRCQKRTSRLYGARKD